MNAVSAVPRAICSRESAASDSPPPSEPRSRGNRPCRGRSFLTWSRRSGASPIAGLTLQDGAVTLTRREWEVGELLVAENSTARDRGPARRLPGHRAPARRRAPAKARRGEPRGSGRDCCAPTVGAEIRRSAFLHLAGPESTSNWTSDGSGKRALRNDATDRHAPAQTVRSPWARAGQDVDSSARVRGRACPCPESLRFFSAARRERGRG